MCENHAETMQDLQDRWWIVKMEMIMSQKVLMMAMLKRSRSQGGNSSICNRKRQIQIILGMCQTARSSWGRWVVLRRPSSYTISTRRPRCSGKMQKGQNVARALTKPNIITTNWHFRSSQLREQGNKAYTSKKNSQALKLYTESVRSSASYSHWSERAVPYYEIENGSFSGLPPILIVVWGRNCVWPMPTGNN